LGEGASETEQMLNSIIEFYQSEKTEKPEKQEKKDNQSNEQ
jgi:hypothetical protein